MRRDAVAVILAAAAVAVFYTLLGSGHGFLYDDRQLIVDEIVPRSASAIARAMTEPYYGVLPYYRPLTRLTYLTQKAIWGVRPFPFLAFNALLASLLVVAAYALMRRPRFFVSPAGALAGAVALAVLPVASSCVLPIAGRDTLLPTVFIVSALACWITERQGLRLAAYALVAAALFAKELAIAAPLLLIAADATSAHPPRGARAWLSRHGPLALIVGLYLGARHVALTGADHPALAGSLTLPLATLAYGAHAVLTPRIDLMYEPALGTWLSLPRVTLALATLAALFWIARRREDTGGPRNALFWLGWFVVIQLPVANVFRQETLFDERYAFPAALAPLALAASAATSPGSRRGALAVWSAAALLLIAGSCAIDVHRASTFASELRFGASWTRTSPDSAAAWNSLGVAQLEARQVEQGEASLHRALASDSRNAQAANNLGVALFQRGTVAEAAAYLEVAMEGSSSFAAARYNLANARVKQGRDAEAEALYREAIGLRPRYVQAWNNLGALLVRKGRADEALVAFTQVVTFDPSHEKALLNRGVLLARRGQLQEAMTSYRAALQLDPEDADAQFDLAAAALASGDGGTADKAIAEALRLRPGWPQAEALRQRTESSR